MQNFLGLYLSASYIFQVNKVTDVQLTVHANTEQPGKLKYYEASFSYF